MVALEEVDSTSDHAAALAREGRPEPPFVVWALRQTRGRGQGSKIWWSDSGGLTFTIALDPSAHGLDRAHEPRLALTTAMAVIEALESLDLAALGLGVRWPNDLEINGRKLGGILPESIETERGGRVLLGVGLNLTSRLDHAPGDVRSMATSLQAVHNRPLAPDLAPRLLAAILDRLEHAIPMLAQNNPALPDRWRSLDLLRDQWVAVDQHGTRVEGPGRGIDDEGALLIAGPNGLVRVLAGRVLRR